jgi:hypothetical protein
MSLFSSLAYDRCRKVLILGKRNLKGARLVRNYYKNNTTSGQQTGYTLT